MSKRVCSKGLFLILAIGIFLIATLFSFQNIQATFSKGNISENLTIKYAPGENLRGWINLSLSNQPSDSPFTLVITRNSSIVSSVSMTIKEFLSKNPGVSYSCALGCNTSYSASGLGSTSASFTLNSGESRLIGFKINDSLPINLIDSLELSLNSKAGETCKSQIKIDLLDDGVIDWYSKKQKSGEFCGTGDYANYGCYNSSATQNSVGMLSDKTYCENITIGGAAGLVVGAKIDGTDANATFIFNVGDSSCEPTSIPANKIISCEIENFSIDEPSTIKVCVTQISGAIYNLNSETENPICGEVIGGSARDFSIFAKPIKYAPLGNINVNSSSKDNNDDFASMAKNYITSYYNSNCLNGCFIPIRIYSGVNNNEIDINNALLKYTTNDGLFPSNLIYNLSLSIAKINMDFKKLSLDNAGFKAPNNSGNYNLTFKLDNNLITSKQIEVVSVPIITDIYPLDVPVGIDITYYATSSGQNITSYNWSFGDNSTSVVTTSPRVGHKYSAIGTYPLTLKVGNVLGEISKTFTIGVVSPKEYLGNSLADFNKKIQAIRAQINSMPPLAKTNLENKLNLINLETNIQDLQSRYNAAGNNTLGYIGILNELIALNIPESVNITEKSSGRFIFDPALIGINDLKSITQESSSNKDENIQKALFAWFLSSLDVNVDLKVYSIIYKNFSSPAFSYVSVSASPKNNLGNIYAVVAKPASAVIFGSSAGSPITSPNAQALSLDMASGAKSFEFILSEKTNLLNLPLYFAPKLSELPSLGEVASCNFNKVCEKDLGEDSSNCRNDCKPITKTIIWLVVVLVIFLVAYIFAQEWYKKYYENYLFKDKNDLFNLIHFIDNAEKQGLQRNEMINKLKEKGWYAEQIDYAYKKFKGKRTGMWEIPLFRSMEKKEIAKQMEIRNKIGMNPNVMPKPISPFVPKQKVISAPLSPSEQKTLPNQTLETKSSSLPAKSFKSAPMPQKPAVENKPSQNETKK